MKYAITIGWIIFTIALGSVHGQISELSRVIGAAGAVSSSSRYVNISSIAEGGPTGPTSSSLQQVYSGFLQSFPGLGPTALPQTHVRTNGNTLFVPILNLLTAISPGPNGGPLQQLTFDLPLSNQATLVISTSGIQYLPQSGYTGTDLIRYKVTDASGITTTGVILIELNNQTFIPPPPVFSHSDILRNQTLGYTAIGAPNYTYRIQHAGQIAGPAPNPVWVDQGTTTGTSAGTLYFEYNPADSPGFFRLVYP